MSHNSVQEVEKQSAVGGPAPTAFEIAVALLEKGDIFVLEYKTGEVKLGRGLKELDVSLTDLGFATDYRIEEGPNRFVTHCTNVAGKMNLAVRQVSDDGRFLTMEIWIRPPK